MGFRSALEELHILEKSSPSSLQKGFSSGVFGFLNPSSMPKMGEREFLRSYQGWVYACVVAIAERVADIEIKFQTKKGADWQDTQTSNPALDLFSHVNDFMSLTDLVFNYEAYQKLNGNTFWLLRKKNGGGYLDIWPLDPTRVQVAKSKADFVAGYVYTPEGSDQIPLGVDEVIHFKRFNPLDLYRGSGTVQAAELPIATDQYASEWQRNFFGNAAQPSGILSTEGMLTQDQYDRIKMNWDAKFKGTENAHKLAIMEGGLKFTQLTPNSREMQFTESRKNIRDEILAIFRVPKPILGILEDVNLASAEAAEKLFVKNVIKPEMRFFIGKLNEFYLPLFGIDPTKNRFWFTDPVPENVEQKLAIIANGRQNNWLTRNEARAQFGYEPKEGGDELDEPTLVAPIEGSDQPDDAAHAQEDEEEEDNAENAKNVKKNFTRIHISKKSKKAADAYKQEQIDLLHKTYLDLNTDLKTRLLDRLQQYKVGRPEITKNSSSLLTRLLKYVQKDTPTNELVRFLFDNYEDWIGLVYNATKEGLTKIFEQSGKTTLADLNLETDFDLQNPRALDWLNQHALEDSQSYADTIKEEMALRIQEGVEQGATNEDIAGTISQFFDETDDWRADRIARTETIAAYAQGNLEGYIQSGVVSGKYWQPDAEACPICLENADAGTIGLDDEFPDGSDAPPAHPNAVFEGYSFVSYGSLKQMLASRYDGPAITLEARLGEDLIEPSSSNSSSLPDDFFGDVFLKKSKGEGNLLVTNRSGMEIAIIPDRVNFTIGPNHPILTSRGFVRAEEIREGDQLLYDLRTIPAITSRIKSNLKEIPMIEDSFKTVGSVFGNIDIATASSYFHGDEQFIHSEIKAVRPTRDLLPVFNASGIEKFCKCDFTGAYTEAKHVAGCSSCQLLFKRLFSTTSSGMGGTSHGDSSGIILSRLPFFQCLTVIASHRDKFVGQAFDASTEDTLYAIGGVVVKNCECDLGGATDEDA